MQVLRDFIEWIFHCRRTHWRWGLPTLYLWFHFLMNMWTIYSIWEKDPAFPGAIKFSLPCYHFFYRAYRLLLLKKSTSNTLCDIFFPISLCYKLKFVWVHLIHIVHILKVDGPTWNSTKNRECWKECLVRSNTPFLAEVHVVPFHLIKRGTHSQIRGIHTWVSTNSRYSVGKGVFANTPHIT